MTAIRNFLELAADQPPFWQGAIAAVFLVCATLMLVALLLVLTEGYWWLHDALAQDGVKRVRVDSPAARSIEEREQIVDDAFAQVRR
jgi:hypothetical protein